MHLNNTQKLINNKIENVDFDSYAILVKINGEEKILTSQNTDENTLFDAASMTKVLVTATLILKAIDEGKLTLEDTIDKFFDNVPDEKKVITVKHLLTHTSGVNRFSVVIPEHIAEKGKNAVVAYLLSNPLPYPTGSAYSYSCYGYILLGFIAESIYNMTLDKAFYKYIKEPLGYTATKFNIGDKDNNSAVCYRRKNRGLYEVDDENAYTLKGVSGNASAFFSLTVLRKDEKLYSKKMFELAETNYTPEMEEGRGLGYLIVDEKYKQAGKLFPTGTFGHCGHTGMSFFINRNLNMYVIILTNATRFAALKNDFVSYNYGDIMKMREDIHNAIYNDLKEQNML